MCGVAGVMMRGEASPNPRVLDALAGALAEGLHQQVLALLQLLQSLTVVTDQQVALFQQHQLQTAVILNVLLEFL